MSDTDGDITKVDETNISDRKKYVNSNFENFIGNVDTGMKRFYAAHRRNINKVKHTYCECRL